MNTRVRALLVAMILLLACPRGILAQDPGGGGEGSITTTVSVTGSPQGDRYVLKVSAETSTPGGAGTPGTPDVKDVEPPPPPSDVPRSTSELPRTTYFTRSADGETTYCMLREEPKKTGDVWEYWYELCLVNGEVNAKGERLHLLLTNIPLHIYYTPGPRGLPLMHVIPYSGTVWIPSRHDVEDVDIVGTSNLSAMDPAAAAAQVLAGLPMPEIEIRANPGRGMVNVPAWFWAEGYDGRPFGRTESVFLSDAAGAAPDDCPPRLPIRSMRVATEYAPGADAIMRSVLGGRLPPILWGWGWSDIDFHQAYLGYQNFHSGYDILMPEGTPLHAPRAGTVTKYVDPVGALVARLTLPSGHTYHFLHLSRWGKLGPVQAGDVIGYSGDTGFSGDPHLHLEMTPPGTMWGEWVPPEHWTCLGGAPGADVMVKVTVRALSYEWQFGDGTRKWGTLGRKYPRESDVKHVYRYSSLGHREGFPVKLVVRFGGTFTINNGPPQQLPVLTREYNGRHEVLEVQSVITRP